jgi:hypothetical protein
MAWSKPHRMSLARVSAVISPRIPDAFSKPRLEGQGKKGTPSKRACLGPAFQGLMAGERHRPLPPFMNPRPRLNADSLWECPACYRPYRHPQRAADCACPARKPLTVAAPLVRCSELPMFDGHLLALTGWLEADQAERTLLHRPEAEGALKATAYRFCALRQSLEATGAFAFVPV